MEYILIESIFGMYRPNADQVFNNTFLSAIDLEIYLAAKICQ